MTEEEASELESIRQKIVEDHEESLTPKEMGEALLATAFMLSFFGSAAVLMPSGGTATGMFSGSLSVDAPVVEDSDIRSITVEDSGIAFVQDSEVYNPNIVEAELQRITYEVIVDGETIARGAREGSTVIPAKDDRMIALGHSLDLRGVTGSEEIIESVSSGEEAVTVEGVMQFRSGGSLVMETYSRTFRMDLS
jgi:LEA14-like dessication related protein